MWIVLMELMKWKICAVELFARFQRLNAITEHVFRKIENAMESEIVQMDPMKCNVVEKRIVARKNL